MKKIHWKNISLPNCPFYLARCVYPPAYRFPIHTHDFAEATWIESGAGKLTINGSSVPLNAGDLYFFRPTDCHSFSTGPDGLVLMNLSFPAEMAISLEQRYFPDSPYFQNRGPMPWSTQLGTEEFAQIAKIFQQLSSATRDRFELDRMLMNLFAIVRKPFADLPLENAPNWLRFACSEMSRPVNLAEGIPAFVRLAGRSPEHTSRELRKQGKCTPTEFINRLRLDHAARLLCTTELSVLETALECGFENQSHFHRCFRTRFRTTPLKYRQKNRAPVS